MRRLHRAGQGHCKTYKRGPLFTVGLDCSGFTRWVYYLAYGKDVLGDGDNNAQRVHKGVTSEPGPSLGDLVFYGPSDNTHHIGIYVGAAIPDPGNYIVNEYGTDYDVEYDLVNSSSLAGKGERIHRGTTSIEQAGRRRTWPGLSLDPPANSGSSFPA